MDATHEIVMSRYSCLKINSRGYRVTIPASSSWAPRVQNNPTLIRNSKARSHPENLINTGSVRYKSDINGVILGVK